MTADAGPADPGIVVSTWYGGGRTRATMVRPPVPGDAQRWRRDLERIASTGLTAFRCWVDWASAEAHPGAFDVPALDLLLDLAEEIGLGVYVQVYLDSAPDWLGQMYPDGRYVADSGVAVDSQGSPGYCYDHPAVRESAERFLVRLAERVAGRTAFRGWDLWSEPHIVQWSYFDFLVEPAMFCYCRHTEKRFRGWLRGRYGDDLDALNRAWYRTFRDWDEVVPPRFTTLMTSTCSLDWQAFLMDKLAADLRWRHDAVRRADHHLTTAHSAMPCLLTIPTSDHGSPDDWRMPASVDVYGTSLYPKHLGAAETADPAFRSALLAGTYSACGGPFWLGELQGGHGYVGTFAAPVSGADVRSYAWQPVAHGATGLHFYAWYPMTTGIESGGFGLADLAGEPTERAYAAGEVARVTAEHADLFSAAQPWPADVAIVWNVHAGALWAAMGESWHYVPSRSYIGCYRALWRDRLPADFVHPDRIAASGVDERHRALYLPFALALPQRTADAVAGYVRRGGTVVAEARTGWNDETGNCGTAIPGLGLHEVFGARERDAERLGVPGDDPRPVPMRVVGEHPLLPGLAAGDTITGALFRQRLDPDEDADVLAVFDDGSPAIVVHRYGSGWAVLVGSMVSLGRHVFDDDGARRFLAGIARAAGAHPPVRVRAGDHVDEGAGVEARLLRAGDDRLLIALNHTNTAIDAEFELDPSPEEPTVHDLLAGEHLPAQPITRRLEPYDVAVLHLSATGLED